MRQTAYERLARDLLRSYVREQLPEGARVKSVAQIAETYGVSSTTAHRSMTYLVDAGVLATDGTRGTMFRGVSRAREVLARLAWDAVEDGVADLELAGILKDQIARRIGVAA